MWTNGKRSYSKPVNERNRPDSDNCGAATGQSVHSNAKLSECSFRANFTLLDNSCQVGVVEGSKRLANLSECDVRDLVSDRPKRIIGCSM